MRKDINEMDKVINEMSRKLDEMEERAQLRRRVMEEIEKEIAELRRCLS